MKRNFYDIDITTNMLPDNIVELFCDKRIVDTGKKHGTITVFFEENSKVEITSYRIDGEYLDNRRPNEVSFNASLNEDLSRRDFTINALCTDESFEIIDCFGGIFDIENKIIRCIGDPQKRFCEDALRILRAFRFMSQLSFTIEKATQNAIYTKKSLLNKISMERIFSELSKLLQGENCLNTVLLMQKLKVLPNILNPLTKALINALKASENILEIRLAICISIQGLEALKLPKKMKNCVLNLIECKNAERLLDKAAIKYALAKSSYEEVRLRLSYLACFEEDTNASNAMLLEIIAANECYCLKQLKIKGNDLKKIGITSGKQIGEMLQTLLAAVIEQKVKNEKDDLLIYSQKLAKFN